MTGSSSKCYATKWKIKMNVIHFNTRESLVKLHSCKEKIQQNSTCYETILYTTNPRRITNKVYNNHVYDNFL